MDPQELSKGQQTREALLEIAFTQFTSQGFHGTSMRQIAREAAMTVEGRHLPTLLDNLMPQLRRFTETLAQADGRLRVMPSVASVRILIGSLLGFVISEMLLKHHPQTKKLVSLDEYVEVLLHGLLMGGEEHT